MIDEMDTINRIVDGYLTAGISNKNSISPTALKRAYPVSLLQSIRKMTANTFVAFTRICSIIAVTSFAVAAEDLSEIAQGIPNPGNLLQSGLNAIFPPSNSQSGAGASNPALQNLGNGNANPLLPYNLLSNGVLGNGANSNSIVPPNPAIPNSLLPPNLGNGVLSNSNGNPNGLPTNPILSNNLLANQIPALPGAGNLQGIPQALPGALPNLSNPIPNAEIPSALGNQPTI